MTASRSLRVLAIEPYFGLSHRTFLEGYRRYSRHQVELWTLPPRKWKWRMRGSAYHFAERARTIDSRAGFDVVFTSDFLNLPDWRALAPRRFGDLPAVVYFHENQITYPLGQHAPVDFHYGWINVSTALAADRLLFNSQYHREEFFASVRNVFQRMPDHVPQSLIEALPSRSAVFPVGIDFAPHEEVRQRSPARDGGVPRILWNHRWEYDKGPELFFETLVRLKEEGVPFKLVVCGQSFKNQPAVFARAKQSLGDRIEHFGFFADPLQYYEAVCRCDHIVSTAIHEFFGVSVIEGIFLGCLPVLPKRLSYPEIVPVHLHPFFLYPRDEDLKDFLREALGGVRAEYRGEMQESMERFHWRTLAPLLDRELEEVVEFRSSGG